MIHPYASIINYEGDEFDDYLNKCHLISVFEDVIKAFPERENYKGIIKFIAWGYSIQSDELVIGMEWGKTRDRLFKKSLLPENLYEQVALLKNDAVLSSIQKYLTLQNDENFVQYVTYRDLRRQMLSASLAGIIKSSGETDYDQKFKCAEYSKDLLDMMNDALNTFIQNNAKLKDSIGALNKAVQKQSNSFGVETFSKNGK